MSFTWSCLEGKSNADSRKYSKWCDNYMENRIVIAYDTMWESAKKMAEFIAGGIRNVRPDLKIVLYNSAINNGILPSMAALIEGVKG